MKSLLIAIKPKWCAKIMNGEKDIEVRKNKALISAIQKLIDENGYAEIYVYCSKDRDKLCYSMDMEETPTEHQDWKQIHFNKRYYISDRKLNLNGKVPFKFRCYKVEEISHTYLVNVRSYFIGSCLTSTHFSKECCLGQWELDQYLKGKKGGAIHISDLEIFDKPKELSEFFYLRPCFIAGDNTPRKERIHKAPQNFCYIEV